MSRGGRGPKGEASAFGPPSSTRLTHDVTEAAASRNARAACPYDPPRAAGLERGRISFLMPALSLDGEIELRRLGEPDQPPPAAPVFPPAWRRIAVADLPAWLEEAAAGE